MHNVTLGNESEILTGHPLLITTKTKIRRLIVQTTEKDTGAYKDQN